MLFRSGQTELAIAYLSAMQMGEKNQALKMNYQVRLRAFSEVRRIELARDRFKDIRGKLPESIEQLQRTGLLSPAPVDPYGGRFFIDQAGKVSTTSKFAFATKNK